MLDDREGRKGGGKREKERRDKVEEKQRKVTRREDGEGKGRKRNKKGEGALGPKRWRMNVNGRGRKEHIQEY